MLINSVEELAKWKAAKDPLFSIRRVPRDARPPLLRGRRIRYVRRPKSAVLFLGGLRISWRRPATLESLWAAAWDTGWRSGWGAGHRTACRMLGGPKVSPPAPAAPRTESVAPAELVR